MPYLFQFIDVKQCSFVKSEVVVSNQDLHFLKKHFDHCTEVRFSSFFSGGFTTITVINPPERKLAKRTSVQWSGTYYFFATWYNKPAIAAYFVMYLLVGTKSILP